jgi:pimeloyl-ACP methyl ester carboxylesterase
VAVLSAVSVWLAWVWSEFRLKDQVAKKLGNYRELGREAARRIPNASLIEFPQLGHAPQIQAPDEFHAALLRALTQR